MHAKGTAALTDLRASKIQKFPGGAPRKFLNFRSSEIDSGAFWDDFPAWQGTHTICNHCCKFITLYAHTEQSIELCPNLDLIIPPAP